ncbi:MAG: YhjD/YihY/BrkB family envelope integrity protein [Desulfovibrio sp.]|uniref:YhjD/YihY/BrkB family envelope integrity protein n=1 Tax=Desulfovibrio sp. 7SRBS1 TaxID=3378064 RepID=UPI003B3CC44F
MFNRRIRQFIKLFTHDIWFADLGGMDRGERTLFGFFRLLYIVAHGFLRDKCLLRAAALSYTTVLSIAPFLAVAFSISKALGLQNTEYIRSLLMRASAGRAAMVDQILTYVDQTNVKTLGTLGLVILLFSVISLMGTIESAFNDIWGIKKGRRMWRKFTDFFSVTLICPVFVLAGVSLTVSLENDSLVQSLLDITAFNYLHLGIIKIAPYIMIGLALTVLYVFIPNTKVKIVPAVVGGIFAALLWQSAQWAYITYQIGASNYNAIYGSFAQFPLFLVWLYISWSIVLLGSEIGYAIQHAKSFAGELRAEHVSRRERDHIGVLVMLLMTADFETGRRPEGASNVAARLKVPAETVAGVLADLHTNGMVLPLEGDDHAYALARDPDQVRLLDIILALSNIPPSENKFIRDDYLAVSDNLDKLLQSAEKSPDNLSLKEFHILTAEREEASSPLA